MNYNLSKPQEAIYYLSRFNEDSITNIAGDVFFDFSVSVEAAKEAILDFLNKCDVMHTRIIHIDGKPMQKIWKNYNYSDIPVIRFENYEEYNLWAKEYAKRPIDINGCLYKIFLIDINGKIGLYSVTHHIISDATSFAYIGKYVTRYLKGEQDITIYPYYDYIQSEKLYETSKRYDKDRLFWLNEFQKIEANYYHNREIASKQSIRLSFLLDRGLCEKIKKFCKLNIVTEYVFFFSIIAIKYFKTIQKNEFFIGTPILNRLGNKEENMLGVFINTVPVGFEIQDGETFTSFCNKTSDKILSCFRHQKYHYTQLLKDIVRVNDNNQKLFDVLFSFWNVKTHEEANAEWFSCCSQIESLQIHIDDRKSKGLYQMNYDYQSEKFTENDIKNLHKNLSCLIFDALSNPDKKITELDILSADEKQKLLYEFNNTSSNYAKDKCIHELFEAQVECTPDKAAVVACDKTLTYRQLNEEANKIAHSLKEKGIGQGDIVGLMLPRKSCLLSALLGILKSGAAYLPIDPDYPEGRIQYMLTDSGAKLCIDETNIAELIENPNNNNPDSKVCSADLCYCIYTSGSTGKPKGTLLTHKNVVNYVSANDKNVFYGVTGKACESILSVTTAGFDIFVTESLLPLSNGLKIILADENQSKLQSKLSELLKMHPADVMQTTPTKMKSLISDKSQLDYLKSFSTIILGGEVLDSTIVEELQAVTAADIYNIYGPTEATVCMTTAKVENPDEITIGKPLANTRVYIVDKHLKPVPTGVQGELCIAGDCVCDGYLNRPELTAEKFIDNPFGEGKLYRTGDNAYWREDGNIVYVGRSDFQVKIRGLRIELGEIESAIQAVNGINRAVVVVRKDKSDRQLICAFYTGEEKKVSEIKDIIGGKLPKYMIPHVFTHLEEMPLTASGKANRNALPEIDLENIGTHTEYIAPETEQEAILTECICTVLGSEKVSVLDNFFDIGGDSLKSIELTAKLESKGYTVPIKTIFECKDIRNLAAKLQKKQSEDIRVEYDKVLPATTAQMRVYTAQMLAPESTLYNISYAFKVSGVNKNNLETAVNKLIDRHESLRTHFEAKDGVICQVIDESAEIKAEEITDIDSFSKAFDLSKSPLIRVGCNKDTVVIDMHHIAVDGETVPILFKELNELYMGRELSRNPIQYGEFAVINNYTDENEKYWLGVFADEVPDLELPRDYQRPTVQSFKGRTQYSFIEKTLHDKIEAKCKNLGITPYVYYMACLSVLLSKLSGNEDIVIGSPVSGRTSRFLDTVGMFVNTVALRSRPEGTKKFAELLNEIKETSISAIDNQNYPFGELVKKLGIDTAGRNPLFDVMLSYQSFRMTDITFGDEKAELLPLETTTAKCDMTFNILPRKDDVVLVTEYCTDLYTEERISRFTNMYCALLETCLDDNRLIKDISVISMDEKNLLDSFNNTFIEYDKTSCIHELFEAQVECTPDNTALVACDKTLTYRQLNEEANKIAHSLKEKGIGQGDIVGLMLPRKSCLLSALLGILKSGAAYLPLDPDYPEERINSVLSDSNAKLCISQKNFYDLLENTHTENLTNTATPDDFCYCIYTSGSTGNPKGTLLYHRNLIWYMSVLKNIYGTDNINMPFFTSQSVDLTVPSFYLPLLTGGTTYVYDGDLNENLADIFSNDDLTILKATPTHINIICKLIPDNLRPNLRCIIVGGESLYKESCMEFLRKFGNHIEIHNEYGPTETTVSCTDYIFRPDENNEKAYLPIGSPVNNAQLYITDNYMQPVPLGVTGELCIAGDGVGGGYLNNPQLTAEKFIDNPFGNGKLYKTGDLAYWREDGNIVFVGRKDYQVKIRGLRIELGEIESAIQAVEEIDMAVVVVRKDSKNRDLICAFYTGKEKDPKALRKALGKKLPKYMLPHIFTYLEEMPLTTSGKINRNALPEVNLENIGAEAEFVTPATPEEKALADAVCSVLNLDGVNMLENFFNIGGDSIKAIYIVSELENMDYELHVYDIMQKDTLADIAKTMRSKSDKAIYDQTEVNGFIPFSPIMRAFLYDGYIIPKDYVHSCVISADCDEDTAKKALDALISHHDILRGSFCENGIEILPTGKKDVYSFETITVKDRDEAMERLNNINISDDTLINVSFFSTAKDNLISITIHHFLIDLVSWEILMRDFQTAVKQLNNHEEISLPAKTASFMMWSQELQKYSETISDEARAYWKNIDNMLDRTGTVHSSEESENEAETFNFSFDENISGKLLNEVNTAYGTRTNEVLLTALGLAAGKIAGGSVGIIVESHGRTELNKPIAIERTVGWFTSCYPVVVNNNLSITDELISIKETIRRIPKIGIDYLLLSQNFHQNLNIKFNFYKNSLPIDESVNELVAFNSVTSVFPQKINVNCFIIDDILKLNISVPVCKHKKGISNELGTEFITQIENLVRICTETDKVIKTKSDFSDDGLTEIELNELKDLFDWTDNDEQ